ncbi:hypothetical protein DRP44_01830, partial [candidate division TA06 bacterium]
KLVPIFQILKQVQDDTGNVMLPMKQVQGDVICFNPTHTIHPTTLLSIPFLLQFSCQIHKLHIIVTCVLEIFLLCTYFVHPYINYGITLFITTDKMGVMHTICAFAL